MKKIALTLAAAALAFAGCQNSASVDVDATAKSIIQNDIACAQIMRTHADGTGEFMMTKYGSWYYVADNVVAVEGGFHAGTSGLEDRAMFYVNDLGQVFTSYGTNPWTQVFGIANAVEVSSNGDDTYAVNAEGNVFKLNASGSFDYFGRIANKAVKKLDVDTNGDLWVITTDSYLYRYANGVLTTMYTPSQTMGSPIPQDVGCAKGEVYVAAAAYGHGAGSLYKYDAANGSWISQNQNAHKVDVDSYKTVYVVDQWAGMAKREDGNSTWEYISTLQEMIGDIGAQ